MVTIRGKVINHFELTKHAEEKGLSHPELALIRLRPSTFTFDGFNYHHCNYSLSTNFQQEIPLIHFTYSINQTSVLSILQVNDLVELEVKNNSFYYKPAKLYGIKESDEGIIRFININCRDRLYVENGLTCNTVSYVTLNTSNFNKAGRWVSSTVDFIERLGGFTLPTLPSTHLDLSIKSSTKELVEV